MPPTKELSIDSKRARAILQANGFRLEPMLDELFKRSLAIADSDGRRCPKRMIGGKARRSALLLTCQGPEGLQPYACAELIDRGGDGGDRGDDDDNASNSMGNSDPRMGPR